MGWLLSEWFTNIYLLSFFLKHYAELRSENMGVYWHWLIFFIIIFFKFIFL